MTLGQVACDEKSNEITAIPELLQLLSLKGATVTIDAMGCQKEIAAQIREQKGHYLLQVKGNQPQLEEQLVQHFEQCLESDFAGVEHRRSETTETGHGRTETRIVDVVALPEEFAPRADWKDLRTLVVVTSERVVDGKSSWESRCHTACGQCRSVLPRGALTSESSHSLPCVRLASISGRVREAIIVVPERPALRSGASRRGRSQAEA
ncbi:MAG: ISAs1 family transposase [Planctomycetaceae bacterium]